MKNDNPDLIRDYNKPENHSGFVYIRVGNDNGVPFGNLGNRLPRKEKTSCRNTSARTAEKA